MSASSVYGIVVAGELGERYAADFEGMETKSGQTILTGDVID